LYCQANKNCLFASTATLSIWSSLPKTLTNAPNAALLINAMLIKQKKAPHKRGANFI
jgi:hypothetical protein